jgi:folate-binding protein YgfZ
MAELSFLETANALRDGAVASIATRAVIRVSGPDALSYLQGQLSQDIAAIKPGESADALLLSPQGKLDAYVRVGVRSQEELLVDLEPDYGELALARLQRFKLRVKATLDMSIEPMVILRGPRSRDLVAPGVSETTFAYLVEWPGLVGIDVVGAGAALPVGVDIGDPAALEVARIEAGWPLMGRELDEQTIAAAAGVLERTVSFTKGCYTGQELVARLDSRGNNVPFRLRSLVIDDAASVVPESASKLFVAEKSVGTLTSAAFDANLDRVVGLGYVHRDVAVPGECTIQADGKTLVAHVRELPSS